LQNCQKNFKFANGTKHVDKSKKIAINFWLRLKRE
jgi:hypothetical protein